MNKKREQVISYIKENFFNCGIAMIGDTTFVLFNLDEVDPEDQAAVKAHVEKIMNDTLSEMTDFQTMLVGDPDKPYTGAVVQLSTGPIAVLIGDDFALDDNGQLNFEKAYTARVNAIADCETGKIGEIFGIYQ